MKLLLKKYFLLAIQILIINIKDTNVMKILIFLMLFIVNTVTAQEDTPKLFTAIKSRSVENVKEVLRTSGDVNFTDINLYTPLMIAVFDSNASIEIIDLLINAGANVNATCQEEGSVLMFASTWVRNPAIIQKLIQAGAEVNYVNKYKETALMHASTCTKNPEIIKALLKAGADLKMKDYLEGKTALLCAAFTNKNPGVISALIEAGADVNDKTKYGQSALKLAKRFNEGIVPILEKAGAKE
jgi:uncharacterized protein